MNEGKTTQWPKEKEQTDNDDPQRIAPLTKGGATRAPPKTR